MNVTTNSVPKDAEGASINIDDNKGNNTKQRYRMEKQPSRKYGKAIIL